MDAPPQNKVPRKITDSQLFWRVLAIALLAPVTLLVIWQGGRLFSALIAFCAIILIFEWTRIVNRAEFRAAFYALSVTAIISIYVASSGFYQGAYLISVIGGVIAMIIERIRGREGIWALIAAFYIIVPGVALIWIRYIPDYGRDYIILLFLTVWMTDIGAYAVGRLVGGPKMIPAISPNKTWAGAIGGVLAATIACALISRFAMGWTNVVTLSLIGAALSTATVIGDITESALKRQFGVKDSGGYIPGHGGLLDRLDGFLFATVMMALVIYGYGFFFGGGQSG